MSRTAVTFFAPKASCSGSGEAWSWDYFLKGGGLLGLLFLLIFGGDARREFARGMTLRALNPTIEGRLGISDVGAIMATLQAAQHRRHWDLFDGLGLGDGDVAISAGDSRLIWAGLVAAVLERLGVWSVVEIGMPTLSILCGVQVVAGDAVVHLDLIALFAVALTTLGVAGLGHLNPVEGLIFLVDYQGVAIGALGNARAIFGEEAIGSEV